MSAAQKIQLSPDDIAAERLRVSCSSSLWNGLAGQLLGAFPDSPEIVELVAERHGVEIEKALAFVASRVVNEICREGLVPVAPSERSEFSGYLSAQMGVRG